MMGDPQIRVLLDIGSTNSRAWRVEAGAIVASSTRPVGVRNSASDGHSGAVRSAVAELIREVAPSDGKPYHIAAAGMITSAQGLLNIPHVVAPAAASDLARAAVLYEAPDLSDQPILLVPGVRTAAEGSILETDIMRGEETLTIGLAHEGTMVAGDVLLNAGSHWKAIALGVDGRVARSRTSLGGELVHSVQTSTLLAASLPRGPLALALTDWLDAGSAARDSEGLLRALFAVRLLDLAGASTAEQRFAWLLGACIREDVDALCKASWFKPGARILISGPGAVPAAWAHLLRRQGLEPRELDSAAIERAFIGGLCHIASLREHMG